MVTSSTVNVTELNATSMSVWVTAKLSKRPERLALMLEETFETSSTREAAIPTTISYDPSSVSLQRTGGSRSPSLR